MTFFHGKNAFQLTREPWYDGNPGRACHNTLVMASTWNVENHKIRRRIWDGASTAKALDTYDSRIIELTDRVIRCCEEKDGSFIDLSTNIHNFSFDIMGHLGFREDFGMIEGKSKEFQEWAGIILNCCRMLFSRPPGALVH